MKLANADRAIIPTKKLSDYLLSTEHPIGRFKAAFFANLGYTKDNWRALEADLRSQHLSLDAEEAEETGYGKKFTITGPIRGPSGSTAPLFQYG